MAKMKSSLVNMFVVLTGITCLSGAVLGAMSSVTKEAIDQSKLNKQQNAIKAVAPDYDNDPIAEKSEAQLADGTTAIIFPAKKNGELVGAAVQAVTKKGFGGEVTIMVGFDKEGTINEYTVLSHAETPGLGSKMPTWFHEKGNVIGKNPGKNKMTVSKDGGEIDAITAATISSRAFLDAVANAYNAFTNSNDAYSGATSQMKQDDCCQMKQDSCCQINADSCCQKNCSDSCKAACQEKCQKEACPAQKNCCKSKSEEAK